MAKLVLSSAGSIVQQCFVDREVVTIGRQPDNALVVDDPAVNAKHATVFPVGNDHILEDLQSDGGTLVNGARISRHILQHGDVIQLGSFYLRYLNPRAASEVDLERTMLIEGLRDPAESVPTRDAPRARRANVRLPSGQVRVIRGARAGETVVLDRVIATFGKPGEQVAVITRRPHGYFVTHVEGRRHPRVNGQSIGLEARALRHGDRIDVGDETLELVLD
ncbi:MAG TPA: FHA domain-containing protein [Casimicrobiaceae bacterium]|nr:FHA domain-containing protein [Casimicrobiaceae bacterium]